MKQMGLSQNEIDASKVIIKKIDGTNIIIENPSVIKMNLQGQESFQISGDSHEEESFSEEDINTIVEKTGCTKEQAKESLKKTKDLADSILELSS